MWLINTSTLELHEFIDHRAAPPYAILSHCWGQDEVSFKDFRKKRNCSGRGYLKIVDCCQYARSFEWREDTRISKNANSVVHHGLDWLWVDTWSVCLTFACSQKHAAEASSSSCIDKRSSSELSEAINSSRSKPSCGSSQEY